MTNEVWLTYFFRKYLKISNTKTKKENTIESSRCLELSTLYFRLLRDSGPLSSLGIAKYATTPKIGFHFSTYLTNQEQRTRLKKVNFVGKYRFWFHICFQNMIIDCIMVFFEWFSVLFIFLNILSPMYSIVLKGDRRSFRRFFYLMYTYSH